MSTEGESSTEDDLLVVPEDPTKINTTSPASVVEPSSDASSEAQPVIDLEMSGTTEEATTPEPVEFDPQYKQSFEGLLFIGKVQRQFKWLGHTFVIKTMVLEDMLEAGQLHRPYVGTVADIKAWQSLMIAGSIVSVDGKPLPVPITDEITPLQTKFDYINQHWLPWTLDALYEQYLILDADVAGVIEAMGKAPGSAESTPG